MTLPAIGFGTSPYRSGQPPLDVEPLVRIALDAGYRLFDLAEAYGNERAVGRALRSLPRDEYHLIGKLWRTNFRPERVRPACEGSLRRLGVESFDLYLLHAPEALRYVAPLDDAEEIGWDELHRRSNPPERDDLPLAETWDAMQKLGSAGLTASIGVSNFTLEQIDTLGEHRPAANQIPCWPFDASVIEQHAQRGITVIGYSPFKRPVRETLRWLIDRGVHPLVSSTNPQHIREDLEATR